MNVGNLLTSTIQGVSSPVTSGRGLTASPTEAAVLVTRAARTGSSMPRRSSMRPAIGESAASKIAPTSQTAEGVKSCESIPQLAVDHGVDMPIVGAVVGVVRGEVTPRQMVKELMTRSLKSEGN